jgi:hypothetical protein
MVLVQRMGTTLYGAANDDPLTPNIDERQGIPAYSSFKNIRLYDGRKNKSSSWQKLSSEITR